MIEKWNKVKARIEINEKVQRMKITNRMLESFQRWFMSSNQPQTIQNILASYWLDRITSTYSQVLPVSD